MQLEVERSVLILRKVELTFKTISNPNLDFRAVLENAPYPINRRIMAFSRWATEYLNAFFAYTA